MSPLKQFEVYSIVRLPELFGMNIDFTNASLYMMLSVVLFCSIFYFGVKDAQVVPGRLQSFVELFYSFVISVIESACGKEGLRYKGFILAIFAFILSCNIAGMLPLPLSFTVTSHFIVTFAISILVFFFITFIGIKNQKLQFFSMFLPAGTPLWLAPLMIVLEVFTYCFRPFSLAVRLSANMIAGHIILKVIAGFVTYASLLFSPLSFVFVMTLIAFEVFIAALQAYVFMILTCVYLNDSLAGH